MYYLLLAGVILLGSILVLFWLKDELQSPKIARVVYSGFVARLALVGAASTILGALLVIADYWGG